jgi:hypothetical protein
MVSAPPAKSVSSVGFWSAVMTTIFCILFSIAAVVKEAGALTAPWDVVLPLAPRWSRLPPSL